MKSRRFTRESRSFEDYYAREGFRLSAILDLWVPRVYPTHTHTHVYEITLLRCSERSVLIGGTLEREYRRTVYIYRKFAWKGRNDEEKTKKEEKYKGGARIDF